MPTFLDTCFVSLARLIFSSSSFAVMANKAVLGGVRYTKVHAMGESVNATPPSSDSFQETTSLLAKHAEMGSSSTMPSFSSSTFDEVEIPSRVPCNTPVPTPLPSSSRLCNQATVETDLSNYKDSFSASFLTTANSFNIPFISDISEEEDGIVASTSSDPLLSSAPVTPQGASFPVGVGLGLVGLSRKDGSAPFDGLGLLSFRPQWREPSTEDLDCLSCAFSPCDHSGDLSLHSYGSADELSHILLQETLLTFTDDPFHEHTLSSIPECQSWYELDQGAIGGEENALMIGDRASPPPPVSLQRRHTDKPLRAAAPHFSASTISSELKRSTGSPQKSAYLSRKRSASWPTTPSRTTIATPGIRTDSESAAFKSISTRGWRI